MSNPTSRYYTAESGNTGSGPFHTASQSLNGGTAGGSGGATGATGGSAGSVSLAPPAWAARLFGGGDQRQEHNAADDDDMVQQGSLELEGMESLRESSVVVRPSPPPLSDAATTPRFGAAARAAAPSPTQLQQPAGSRRYAAEMATTYRPPPPPPGASLWERPIACLASPTPAAAVDPAAAAEAAWSGYQEEAPPLSQKQLFGEAGAADCAAAAAAAGALWLVPAPTAGGGARRSAACCCGSRPATCSQLGHQQPVGPHQHAAGGDWAAAAAALPAALGCLHDAHPLLPAAAPAVRGCGAWRPAGQQPAQCRLGYAAGRACPHAWMVVGCWPPAAAGGASPRRPGALWCAA